MITIAENRFAALGLDWKKKQEEMESVFGKTDHRFLPGAGNPIRE